MRTIELVLMLSLAAMPAAAQPPAPAPTTAVDQNAALHQSALKFCEAFNVRQRLEQNMDKLIDDGKQALVKRNPLINPQFVDEWAKRMRARVNLDEFVDATARVYERYYTSDELEAYVARVKAERPKEADYVARRTLPDIGLCKERGFAVSLGEWRREIFGVAAPLYRTATGDCLSVNCGIPSFRFSAEQIERECAPRILGLARSIRSLVANDEQRAT